MTIEELLAKLDDPPYTLTEQNAVRREAAALIRESIRVRATAIEERELIRRLELDCEAWRNRAERFSRTIVEIAAQHTRYLTSDGQSLAPAVAAAPVPMILYCPMCAERHVDEGEFATREHHTHACQRCGHVWRPALVATVGVKFLPGFQNEPEPTEATGESP
jgi:hypothetical protein